MQRNESLFRATNRFFAQRIAFWRNSIGAMLSLEFDFSLANGCQSGETNKSRKSLPLGTEKTRPQPWLSPTIPPCQDLTTWGGYVTMKQLALNAQ
jgi:hypothetical protein